MRLLQDWDVGGPVYFPLLLEGDYRLVVLGAAFGHLDTLEMQRCVAEMAVYLAV